MFPFSHFSFLTFINTQKGGGEETKYTDVRAAARHNELQHNSVLHNISRIFCVIYNVILLCIRLQKHILNPVLH